MKAPVVPDAVDGVLDLGRLSGGDVIVRLERYIGIRPGDIITVFFGTSLSSRVIVPYQLPFAGFFDAVFRKNDLLNGVYDVRYDVLDLAGNIGLSQASVVTVVGSPGAVLPAPVFPDAVNGVLASRAIATRGGAAMEASYTAMQAGDVVAFHWSGENALGRPVAAATWDGEPYTVDAADKALGRVATLVPKSFVLALGDGGRGAAFYTVVRRGAPMRRNRSPHPWRSSGKISPFSISSPRRARCRASPAIRMCGRRTTSPCSASPTRG